MIKKALLALTLAASSALTAAPPLLPPPAPLSFSKDLVIKAWNGKTPEFIMKQFGKPLNLKEVNKLGLDRWIYDRDDGGKEHLLTYKIVLVDKGWRHQGREVLNFQADFYKPFGSSGPYKCWDAFYLLAPKPGKTPMCVCPAPKGHKCAVHPSAIYK